MPVLRWSRPTFVYVQFLRDEIMRGVGSSEPFIVEDTAAAEAALGVPIKAMHWRKPLSIEEINRMAPTPEVRARPGRP